MTGSRRPVVALALGALLSVCTTPLVAHAKPLTCLTGTDPSVANDAGQINALRGMVDQVCPCWAFDGSKGYTHRNYTQCAAASIKAQVPAGLRMQCVKTVKAYYGRSTCGRNPALHTRPCIITSIKTGKVRCAIKSTTKKDGSTPSNRCADGPRSTQVSCPALTTCIDAADTNADLLIAAPGDSGACNCNAGNSLPSGTYMYSCVECSVSNCQLTCGCARADVDPNQCPDPIDCPVSSLTLPCANDIYNSDGHLTCS